MSIAGDWCADGGMAPGPAMHLHPVAVQLGEAGDAALGGQIANVHGDVVAAGRNAV